MTTNTRKKSKAGSKSSTIKVRKVKKPKDDGHDLDDSSTTDGAEDMAARIGKRVGDKLGRDKLEARRKRRKSPSVDEEDTVKDSWLDEEPEESEDSVDSVDSDESIDEDFRSSGPRRRARKGGDRGLIEKALSFLPGSGAKDYERVIDILERMDEFGKIPDIDNRLEALMTFLYEKYWRVETTGLENIPDEGRALIVSNHSGVLPFDGAMMATAIYNLHPAGRHARFLIEDWFGRLPFATEFMSAVGQVRACQENAERLLRQEQLVGVFPEGIKGMAKGFKDRYNLARFGRGGVIRLVLRTKSPVIPCAVVGAEEIYIVLGYANWLGKMFGVPLSPITVTFPWLGPLGFVPLPTKWYIHFGEMISYDEYDESALKDNVIINRLNRELRGTVQEMVDSLLKKRRSLFFG